MSERINEYRVNGYETPILTEEGWKRVVVDINNPCPLSCSMHNCDVVRGCTIKKWHSYNREGKSSFHPMPCPVQMCYIDYKKCPSYKEHMGHE